MATFYRPVVTIPHPVSGDLRKNLTNNSMEIYTGSCWETIVPEWEHKKTLSESVAHTVDTIAMSIAEDHAHNATIQDAYSEWSATTERFRVVVAIADK